VTDRDRPAVAVFRPDDERLERAADLLDSLGVEPVPDPMLAVDPTGGVPRSGADLVVFTSKTGAEIAEEGGWSAGDATVAAIGPRTAEALRDSGYEVDVVPGEYTSSGLVDALADRVEGATVEVARSDHGSPVLLEGLADAGADVHETVLYELARPPDAGDAAELAATGDLAGAVFTSSLTVEHFLAVATDRGVREEVRAGLAEATVGAIGPPTAETARERGISVDVVPVRAEFEALARAVTDALAPADR